jgi:hypothetical protein
MGTASALLGPGGPDRLVIASRAGRWGEAASSRAPSCRAGHKNRADHQHEVRQGARHYCAASAVGPRRRGDRISAGFAAIAHGRLWHEASFRCSAKARQLLDVKRTFGQASRGTIYPQDGECWIPVPLPPAANWSARTNDHVRRIDPKTSRARLAVLGSVFAFH